MRISNITCFPTAYFLATYPQATRQSKTKTCYTAQADPELWVLELQAWDTPPGSWCVLTQLDLGFVSWVHKWLHVLPGRANATSRTRYPSIPSEVQPWHCRLFHPWQLSVTLRSHEHPAQAHLEKDKRERTRAVEIGTGGLCTGGCESVKSNYSWVYSPETNNQIRTFKRNGWQTGS